MASPSLRHSKINPGPENTAYDRRRHEEMRLKTTKYGVPKIFMHADRLMCCTKCVFNDGSHTCGQS